MNDVEKYDISVCANYFAPKCYDRDENFEINNSHCIATTKCNFKCSFCRYGVDKSITPQFITMKEFENLVNKLFQRGRMFKFTGGEPCMNPKIYDMVKVVKKHNGLVFFDTNGSIKNVVKKLINDDLIDVLGVSLKGLTPDMAQYNSGIANITLCWDNVFEVISCACKHSNVRVIVTYVAFDNFAYEDLIKFASLFEFTNNLYLKINNLCGNIHRNNSLKPIKSKKLEKMLVKFVKKNEVWKNHIILINSSEGVTDYSKIKFY